VPCAYFLFYRRRETRAANGNPGSAVGTTAAA
jgi:hypothetical protein